jgi:antitoxin VapB
MAVLIKGDEIDRLLARYCAITGETNKSEAVRKAIAAQIDLLSAQPSLAERVSEIQRLAEELGFEPRESDIEGDKAFMDEMWGDA